MNTGLVIGIVVAVLLIVALIGLAAIRTDRPRADLWAASRIDENWQEEL